MRAWMAVGLLSLFASFRWALAADSCVHEGVASVGNRFFLLEGCNGQTAEFGMVWKRNGTVKIRFTVQQGDLDGSAFFIEFAKGCRIWITRFNTERYLVSTAYANNYVPKFGDPAYIELGLNADNDLCNTPQFKTLADLKLYSKLTVRVPRAAVGFVMLVTSTDGDLRRLDDEP